MRILLLALLVLTACSTTSQQNLPPLQTVKYVDLDRYTGTWFEIASFPLRFWRGCVGTTARYALDGAGNLVVVNRCRADSFTGPDRIASGAARVVDTQTNAKLEVSFQWPIWRDYWIIDLDPGYRWAVVGHPSRDSLWILAREPRLDPAAYDGIVARLREQRYDVERLQQTQQH